MPGGTGWTATSTRPASGGISPGCMVPASAGCSCSTAAWACPSSCPSRCARDHRHGPRRSTPRCAPPTSSVWSWPSRPRRAGARPAARGFEPADAMKKVVWSETVVDGGDAVADRAAAPAGGGRALSGQPSRGAARMPPASRPTGSCWRCRTTRRTTRSHPRACGASAPIADWSCLVDGSFGGSIALPRDPDAWSTAWVEQVFDEPVTVRSVVIGLPGPARLRSGARRRSRRCRPSDDGVATETS